MQEKPWVPNMNMIISMTTVDSKEHSAKRCFTHASPSFQLAAMGVPGQDVEGGAVSHSLPF